MWKSLLSNESTCIIGRSWSKDKGNVSHKYRFKSRFFRSDFSVSERIDFSISRSKGKFM